jgi:tRNA(Arg) A34 adenosine deaminase TadA
MDDADLHHLRHALRIAVEARGRGNHPFGALLVGPDGDVLAVAGNTVLTDDDVTGHAETNLVRIASARVPAAVRARSTLYTSTEPCAMCAGAIHWAGIGRVVFALSEADLYERVGPSPLHLRLPCRELFAHSARPVIVEGPAPGLADEASAVHDGFWR